MVYVSVQSGAIPMDIPRPLSLGHLWTDIPGLARVKNKLFLVMCSGFTAGDGEATHHRERGGSFKLHCPAFSTQCCLSCLWPRSELPAQEPPGSRLLGGVCPTSSPEVLVRRSTSVGGVVRRVPGSTYVNPRGGVSVTRVHTIESPLGLGASRLRQRSGLGLDCVQCFLSQKEKETAHTRTLHHSLTPRTRVSSIIHSFSHSVIQSFSHSIIQSFSHSIIQSFSHSVLQSFSHSVIQSFSHSIIQSFNHSVIQSFSHSVIQSFSHSVSQSFNHSVIQ